MTWTVHELGELLSYEQPTPYIVKSTKYDDSFDTPVLTAGKSFIIGYTDETDGIYDTPPVIIFDDFTTSTQYVNFRFKVKSSAMKILTANTTLVLPKYIFYRMQIIDFDHSTHKRYWIQHYSKLKVKVPSIPEQERIVARIEELFSELDKAEETLQATKQQLEVYRQAVYSSVFSQDFPLKPITDFFDITGGLTKNSKRNELSIKMPYLRVANVYYNKLDLSEIKYIGVTKAECERFMLQKNDLLFVEGNGSKGQIGRVAIWDGSISNCLHQNHLIKARVLQNMLPQYALYYFISSGGRKQILDAAKSTSGLYTLSTNKIKALMIPYCDYQCQCKMIDEIESRLSVCHNVERTVDRAFQQSQAMRRSILKEAFEGRLI